MGTQKSFTYTLLGTGPNHAFPYIEMPFDTVAFFGTKARVAVKITINDVELRASLAPMGGRHVIGFSGALAKQAGIAVGDKVRVTVAPDDAPRTVAIPADLAKALRAQPAAKKAWEALAYTHRREHARSIEDAKKPETRAARVAKTMAMLTTTGRPARPAPSAKPLSARLHIKPGAKVAVVAAPTGFALGVPTSSSVKGADVALLFVASRAALEKSFPKVRAVAANGALWIVYPKTMSGKKTDLTRDAGWEVVERAGLNPVTQVAVDETWSALRFR